MAIGRGITLKVQNTNRDHKDQIVEILAEAFVSDPVLNWVCPDTAFPGFLFNAVAPFCFPHHHTYMTDDGKGTALWLPPGVDIPFPFAGGILLKILRSFGFGTFWRGLRAFGKAEQYHYRPPHFYLLALGVLEEARCKGSGSTLIRDITTLCDEMNMPAYLENSNERNLSFYQRHGFRTIREVQFDYGPTLWFMLREPGA